MAKSNVQTLQYLFKGVERHMYRTTASSLISGQNAVKFSKIEESIVFSAKTFILKAVLQYNVPEHQYIVHIKRNETWETYDDSNPANTTPHMRDNMVVHQLFFVEEKLFEERSEDEGIKNLIRLRRAFWT